MLTSSARHDDDTAASITKSTSEAIHMQARAGFDDAADAAASDHATNFGVEDVEPYRHQDDDDANGHVEFDGNPRPPKLRKRTAMSSFYDDLEQQTSTLHQDGRPVIEPDSPQKENEEIAEDDEDLSDVGTEEGDDANLSDEEIEEEDEDFSDEEANEDDEDLDEELGLTSDEQWWDAYNTGKDSIGEVLWRVGAQQRIGRGFVKRLTPSADKSQETHTMPDQDVLVGAWQQRRNLYPSLLVENIPSWRLWEYQLGLGSKRAGVEEMQPSLEEIRKMKAERNARLANSNKGREEVEGQYQGEGRSVKEGSDVDKGPGVDKGPDVDKIPDAGKKRDA
ncbi:hypothetical protein M409DRAFT_51185 [Zasmidium cellare ATCC 36951]|uniref:Uncharacterized protein n=1 Tax=Zasmidium cellare ATCC 36951 TaxID=1080233 RepID=A0A6A6CW59_ZASCE|nr:uncharacterized protein M409DRAFT_51185 [Zasmidium cellare ATCC 36951]KAF2170943.1 hypothetical protein M409DRAFT_51185 [Zasmidium cellare ATCC 36951]